MKLQTQVKPILISAFSIIALSGAQVDEAQALGLVKVNASAARGRCLPDRKSSVRSVIKKNKILLFTGDNKKPSKWNKTGVSNRSKMSSKDGRAAAVANVMYTVDNIGDGKFTAHKGVRFVFGNPGRSSSNSRRTRYDIQLNPGNQNMKGTGRKKYGGTDNRALIAHELGHYVGRVLYPKYFGYVRTRCKLTGYANKNRNEEFAEVFAAYITNPSLFKGKGRHCAKAFKFFAKQFGESNINQTCKSRLNSLNGKIVAVDTSLRPQVRPDDLPVNVPVPKKRPDDLGKVYEEFELPAVERIPVPIPRPKYIGQHKDLTEAEKSTVSKEDSEKIEEHYKETFRNHPLFEEIETEDHDHVVAP